MANYGKYYIAVRLLLLKQYLEANAGRTRIVKRREPEEHVSGLCWYEECPGLTGAHSPAMSS